MKNPTIHMKDEDVTIIVDNTEQLESTYNISVNGAILKCLKGVHRYQSFTMPKPLMVRILYLALRGDSCKESHLSISQRLSLYDYLKDKEIDDPYIKQFLKETKEDFKSAIV